MPPLFAGVVRRITELLESGSHGGPGPRVVAVDGPSGSGKTSLAEELSTDLQAEVLHMDDVYPGWDGLADGVTILVERILEPLSSGRPAAYRRWDWSRSDWGETVEVPPCSVLVVEGAGSGVGRAGQLADVVVWLDADPETRFARAIGRDGEGFRPYWQMWARQEGEVFGEDRTWERASIRVDTSESPRVVR